MLIKVSQSDFLSALQGVQRGMSAQTTLPILTGIKIIADAKDSVSLQSTDLELSIETKCPASVEKPGAAVVTGKLLVEIFRYLAEGAVEVSTQDDGQYLAVKANKASFKVRTMSPEDFPIFPEVEEKNVFTINSGALLEMIKQTSKAVSRDETRPVLTGAMLNIEKGNTVMVATDSYRLALKNAKQKTGTDASFSILIPFRALEEIQKALASVEGDVRLVTNESLLQTQTENTKIVTRLIEGQFPNYKQLIPKETTLRVDIEREGLIKAINRVRVMAQKNMSIKLLAEGNEIQIKAATQGIGEAEELVKAKTKGEKMGEVAFNAQYLLDGLQSIEGEKVVLEFTGNVNPGLIKSSTASDYLYLIMPIRIS